MAMYATPAELASYLQRDLDTSSATLALTIASDLFAERANTRFEANSTTYSVASVDGTANYRIYLPHTPVTAVSAVRINGVAITDYTRIGSVLYRLIGFGYYWAFPPDLIEVDYTHGYTSVPDSVKGYVLESAAMAYDNPDPAATSESIDDYSVKTAPNLGGIMLSPAAAALADYYRGVLVA
jgi:hypothetical protein